MLRLIRKRDESDRLSAVRKNREINVSFACRSVYGYSFGQKNRADGCENKIQEKYDCEYAFGFVKMPPEF